MASIELELDPSSPNEVYVPELISAYFMKDVRESLDVYHYSDCSGLISILRNSEFWVSGVSFMNDVMEVDNSTRVILKAIENAKVEQFIKDGFFKSFQKEKKKTAQSTFVLSLSMDGDSLSLWSNYGKTEGYNIGLDVVLLSQLSISRRLALKTRGGKDSYEYLAAVGRVLYDEQAQIDFFTILIQRYAPLLTPAKDKNLEKKSRADARHMWKTFVMYSYMIKESSHSSENEFRVVIMVPDNAETIHFRNRNGIVLPYVKLASGLDTLPINEVTIGPKINESIAKLGVQMLLEEYRILANINDSKIRLRF